MRRWSQGRHAIAWPAALLAAATCGLAGCASSSAPGAASPASSAAPPTGTGMSTVASRPHDSSFTCTDTSADAAGLQRVINASTPGSTISIRAGICLLTRTVSLLGDRTYTGGSTTGTVLKQGASMSYVLASASYLGNSPTTGDPLAITGLTVACDGTGSTDGIILLNWQVNVGHVDVSDCGGAGIVDTSTTASGKAIKNTSVNSRFDDNFISHSGSYGFEIADTTTAVTDGYLADNQIAFSGKDAVYLQTASGWDVSGNHLYGTTGDAIDAAGLYGTTIANNYIEDFGAKQRSGTWYGITGTVQGDVGSTISGNKIANDTGEAAGAGHIGIGLTQARGGTGYVAITGNVIVAAQRADTGFSFNGSPDRLIIASAGNLIAGAATVRRQAGTVTITGGT